MKRKFSPEIFKYLIIILTIHIFSVLAGLLHNLNGKNESLWLAFVFAASYSIASAFIVYLANERWLIICYAAADALGVLCYYFNGIPQWIVAIYFAVYTFGLIASTIYLSADPEKEIINMRKQGKTLKEIASLTGTTEYQVSKTLKEVEDGSK